MEEPSRQVEYEKRKGRQVAEGEQTQAESTQQHPGELVQKPRCSSREGVYSRENLQEYKRGRQAATAEIGRRQ